MYTLSIAPHWISKFANKVEDIADILTSEISVDAKAHAICELNESLVSEDEYYTEDEKNINQILSSMCDKAYSTIIAESEDFSEVAYTIDNGLYFMQHKFEIDPSTEDGDELNRYRLILSDAYGSLFVHTESKKNGEEAFVEDNENEFTLSEKYSEVYLDAIDEIESKYFEIV